MRSETSRGRRGGPGGSPGRAAAALLLIATALATAGCNRDAGTATGTATGTAQGAAVQLRGAGSTFAQPIYARWFDDYRKAARGVALEYQGIGSAGGVREVLKGAVDFAGTDAPATDQQLQVFRARYGCELLHLPVALGASVPAYNLPGVTADLTFTPEALAGIYLGTIARWNDATLAGANPGVALPDAAIVVVHRSDGSGTTYVWTDYLCKVSDAWKRKAGAGTTIDWPVGTAAEGNGGVADKVQSTANSIGYVELTFALNRKLAYGAVKNAAGRAVKADPAGVTAAAAGVARDMPADFRVSIADAPGEGAYPVASFTWMLVPEKIEDAAKMQAVKEFLHWAITSGQDALPPLHYAALPREVVEKEAAAIDRIR